MKTPGLLRVKIDTGDVLRGLGVDVPTSPPAPPLAGEGSGEGSHDDEMVSLDQFLNQVVRACKPDAPAELKERLHKATIGMATQPSLQPELRELGRVLNQILSGERHPDVNTLHPQLADVVRGMLAELE